MKLYSAAPRKKVVSVSVDGFPDVLAFNKQDKIEHSETEQNQSTVSCGSLLLLVLAVRICLPPSGGKQLDWNSDTF